MKTTILLPLAALCMTLAAGVRAEDAPTVSPEVAARDCCGGGGGYEPPAGLNGWKPVQRQAMPVTAAPGWGGTSEPPSGLNGWQPAARTALPLSARR